jgi:hypothetical protein
MASGILGKGTKLELYNPTSGNEGWATQNAWKLGTWYVTSLSGPSTSAETLDVTNLGTTGREYISGLIDPGELSLTLLADFGTGPSAQSRLFQQFESGAAEDYRMIFPVTGSFTDGSCALPETPDRTFTMSDVDGSGAVVAAGMMVTGPFLGKYSEVASVDTSTNTVTLTAGSDIPVNTSAESSQEFTFNEMYCSFSGAITQAEYGVPVDGAMTLNVTVKLLGEINWPGTGA